MKTTVINLEGVESVLAPPGVEKQLCKHPGIHKVETNFMTGTATVYHDESMTLAEIKHLGFELTIRFVRPMLVEEERVYAVGLRRLKRYESAYTLICRMFNLQQHGRLP